MNSADKLTEKFGKFPGIGQRQAKRFVYFLLTRDDNFLRELAEEILSLKKGLKVCQDCKKFFYIQNDKTDRCNICLDTNRDESVLMVVGKDADLENIEKTNIYNGKYFILGGYLPILDKNPNQKIRSSELLKTVEDKIKNNNLKEVVLALSFNPEGENTAYYIEEILKPLKEKYGIKITTLGRGLSTGTELEYSDDDTLRYALRNRR